MHRIKMAGLAAIGTGALMCIPAAPASAAGLLFAPWALGHLLRAATLPLFVAAAAASSYGAQAYDYPSYDYPSYQAPPPAAPPPSPYYGSPFYRPPVSYDAPYYYGYGAPVYSAPVYSVPRYGYGYRYGYGRPYARYYAPRGYAAAPRLGYSGAHGAQGWYRSRGHYRHR